MSSAASPSIPPRRLTLGTLAFGLSIGLFVLWCLLHPRTEGDTVNVVQGADAARLCLAHGDLVGCPNVSYFPLFQYLPAAALGAVGVSDAGILHVFAVLSTLSFAAILLLAWRMVGRRAGTGAAVVVLTALVAGQILWYARSTFGEMLAALLMLLFVEAVLSRRGAGVIAATLWLAGITKETALPLLLALGCVALFGSSRGVRFRDVRAQLTGLAAGAFLVADTTFAFNYFRFHSIWNTWNLKPFFRVPGIEQRAENAVALWLSPNGGMLMFWPLAVILGAAALLSGLRLREGGPTGAARWPAVALLGIAAWLTAGFAVWYAPFGWWAWGSRLMLPWIPALLVLATVLYPRPAREVARWVGATSLRRGAAGVVVGVTALPHLASLRSPTWGGVPSEDVLARLFGPDRTCPVPVIMWQVPKDYAYNCLNHVAWAKSPILIDSLRALGSRTGVALTLLLFASCLASLLLAQLGAPRVTSRARASDGVGPSVRRAGV